MNDVEREKEIINPSDVGELELDIEATDDDESTEEDVEVEDESDSKGNKE